MRSSFNLQELINFSICPLKYRLAEEQKITNSATIGDGDLLLGTALKEAFLKFAILAQRERSVGADKVIKEFSYSWTKYKKIYADLGIETNINIDKVTNAYSILPHFRSIVSRKAEIAAVNMPYTKAFSDFEIEDSIDLLLVKKQKGHKKTKVEIVILDNDTQISSRTNFFSRVRAVMQEIFVRRELVSEKAEISTNIINLYNKNTTEVSLAKEHRVNYRRYLSSIVSSINNGVCHPNPTRTVCKKCIFKKDCKWAS